MYQKQVIQDLLANTFPTYKMKEEKQQAIDETEQQFQLLKGIDRSQNKQKGWLAGSFLSKIKTDYTTRSPVTVDGEGSVFPEWKKQLDQAMIQLSSQTKTVSVLDYGAVGDGVTDCTEAFKKAISTGFRCVMIPPGQYKIKGIRLPSYTELIGSGTALTELILSDFAPRKTTLLTNWHYLKGNSHIRIEGLTLDWNNKRIP